VRWALVLFLFAACDDEPTERGKLEPLPESVRRAALAAQQDAGADARVPSPAPVQAAKELPDAGAAPAAKRVPPKEGPFEITLTATNGRSGLFLSTVIHGDVSGAEVQRGATTAKLNAAQSKHLMDALDALDWPNLESQKLPITDQDTNAVTIKRGDVKQQASLYGGCSCEGRYRPPMGRCHCAIEDAIHLIDKTALDAVIAALHATTVNVPPPATKVSGAVKGTVKCHAGICARGAPAPGTVFCFATNKKGVVSCQARPSDRASFSKLDGDLGGSFIWAFELEGGVSCVVQTRGYGDCSDHQRFNDFVPVAGGWATYRGGVPAPLTKAWWTGPPPKDGR
jgi:hypothetical protein